MASHGVPFSSPSQSASKRRSSRRLQPEGEGESSREASAESNDEQEGVSGGEDDLDFGARSPTSGFAPALDSSLRDLALGSPAAPTSAFPTGARAGKVIERSSAAEGGAQGGYASTESAGHDGDISSATAHSSSSLPVTRGSSGSAFRAPVSVPPNQLHHQTSYRSSASLSTGGEDASDEGSPSPPQTETETDGETSGVVEGASKRLRGKAVPSRYEGKAKEAKEEPALWAPAPKGFLSNLTAEDIQEHILRAVAGDPGRAYKINPPPVGRPVRIYADGVYDLLHYGHMLQLRQCKLAFPSVHLLVGVCSSSLVREHKSNPVFSSSERYESLRHVKWCDEVVEDAPWTVDQDFIDKWQIDYIAHDEEPYASAGKEDVYAYAKSIGAFLPTKRTNGISTSELLQRIVEGYREGSYDSKLLKLGHPELCSRQGSEAGTHGTGYGGGAGSVRKDM